MKKADMKDKYVTPRVKVYKKKQLVPDALKSTQWEYRKRLIELYTLSDYKVK